ncbi:DUF6602 domain-containing protein [Winogradskyella aurantia]|uniref:DUF6602 domain-containing protein n=1 Tax=Winogradskyella aurantia TaxID=1915063 RepID=A0A265USX8_9FLAO|nr:DUF6602 domain-containing protein [Winogradskyella aurantia]OZV68414.1 hypothetical protein CA834_07995 [Winogradskyella aurantia]
MELPKLEILSILQQDVEEIFSSRQKSKVLHKTKDIDASGDEVENSVRRVIRRKLPLKYYVSQGHIVDKKLKTSSQLDLIIADNTGSPVLFTSENGTEYFPFESIYSFAEIKSTYYANKKYVESFINSTTKIYEELNRDETPHNQLSQDIGLNFGYGINFTVQDTRPYKNPLFKFILFVDSNDFKINNIKDLLIKTDDKYLPNFICLLDQGMIVKAKVFIENNKSTLGSIELFPQFIKTENKKEYKWVYLEFSTIENRAAANFAFLIFALNTHLKNCLVLKPVLLKYFDGIFTHKGEIIG